MSITISAARAVTIGLLATAGLALAADRASAQPGFPCSDITGEPSRVLFLWMESFSDFFELSADDCEKLAKQFRKACDSAVAETAACADSALKEARKGAKTVCNAGSKNPSQCNGEFKDELDDVGDDYDDEVDEARSRCEEFAGVLEGTCNGDPL